MAVDFADVPPELSRALGRLASALDLTPQAREDLLSQVPQGAQTIADMPAPIRALYERVTREDSAQG
jgi:hypothetical protein